MRCTDPKWGICVIKYHRAGRGTECGTNKNLTTAQLSQRSKTSKLNDIKMFCSYEPMNSS
ncbi:hypothetical protein CHS0354_009880 [Potamilus streckersoni]|uniref:Uncharacterized protein n=1 Tax=Potamilus streckersoni TaxID=2493646 RepID=A0AAE0VQ27_9BIVA|nr:hypothetical protein CHS0354_009880 [Potamilus streckersoni]